MSRRLVGLRFPFVPVEVRVQQKSERFEVLLDTGFEGAIILPSAFASDLGPPDELCSLGLADGSTAIGFTYSGTVVIGSLGIIPAKVMVLRDECLLGCRLADLFTIIFDHGRQIIIEP